MNSVNIYTVLFRILPIFSLTAMIAFWIFTVIRVKGKTRLVLLLSGCAVFLLAVILFGGQWLLERFDLSWRQGTKAVLALLLWCTGLAVGCLTVYFIPRAVRAGGKLLRGIAALCLLLTMGFGTLTGGLWIGPSSDEVIVYHGVKAVQEEGSWLDEHIAIYEYHSPFTRGAKPIGPIGG